ncbi:GntR family transcriptional regulator [Paenibacillus oceani]|uniref:GntR family transcriptional regulator n=1 Tax=Paenibacillus oceani TaxID=2772510 RepID=A0A927H1A0_9BACL|nr:GntR family transcriptional regulator [Paenibacillus oceani]MBD2864946.1 GntR family transcriptional regulator [Paenibacillus oceani]
MEHMVQVLRQEILRGVYTAGDYLPSEPAHASRFGLSNKSVRKRKTNLRDMEQEGLLADFQQCYPWVRVEAKAYETFPDLDEQTQSDSRQQTGGQGQGERYRGCLRGRAVVRPTALHR